MIGFLDFCTAWWSWVVSNSVQVAFGALLLIALDGVARQRLWPQVRLTLWSLLLLKPLLAPLLNTLGLCWQLPYTFDPSLTKIAAPTLQTGAPLPAASLNSTLVTPPLWSTEATLFILWLCGLSSVALLHQRRGRQLKRALLESSTAAPPHIYQELTEAAKQLSLKRLPQLRIAPLAKSPAIFGLLRPTLLLPSSWQGNEADPHRLDAFLHELTHLQRRDLWAQQLFHLLQLLLWFHPGSWWARRRSEELQEVCCDAAVTQRSPQRRAKYRKTLLFSARDTLREAGLLSFSGSALFMRLYWLERGCNSPLRANVARTTFLLLGSAFLPLATTSASTAVTTTVADVIPVSLPGSVQPTPKSPTAAELQAWDRIAEGQLQRAAEGERTSCLQLKYSALYKMAREGS